MGANCCSVGRQNNGDTGLIRASFTNLRAHGAALSRIIKPGTDFTESYVLGQQVGGTDASVVSATNIDCDIEHVARNVDKRTMPMSHDSGDVEEHLTALAKLDHIHICRFVESYEYDSQIQLIYEKATPTSLFEKDPCLKKGEAVPEEQVQVYCRQIASALRVAHKNNILHGRLGPTSLLLDPLETSENCIKICDMGQTFILRPARTGNIDYTAPETLWEEFRLPSDMHHMGENFKTYANVDLWSLGTLLYRMLTGTLPFAALSGEEKRQSDCSKEIEFGPTWATMPDAREVVHSLLRHNGRIRMPADKVLKHPWLMLSKEVISRTKMLRILQNVVYNTQESTFKKFCFRVIAEDMAQEKLDIVQKAFQRIDRNSDGTLEVREIADVLRKYLDEGDLNSDEILDAIDRDASGCLNFGEFAAVSIGRPEYCDKEVLWQTFNRFDRDGNGMFEKEEIAMCLREVEQYAEGAHVAAEVEDIAGDIMMPMDFDTFVHIMITPAGQPISAMAVAWDKFCYSVLKVDNQKVRHINPRERGISPGGKLRKSVYRGTNSFSAGKPSR